MTASRRARPADVDEIAGSLPQTELGTSWGDRPTWKVAGTGFVLRRAPRKDAIDPATGEMFQDLIVVMVANAEEKAALVDDERLPFFTIDHFTGFNAVLVQESRLAEMDREELAEIITEAWAARAPKRLVKEFFASGRTDRA
jgi:hypothetical protein